ncbi:pentatricopeptide repeat-containing protein, mitochondrial-like protein [Cinnamomum micranthum f. kanehirae]|uniref:Pentatricopeptide repeat-containing protein, mitochondrial-like protein n=1 Tax=Cinnamomum micranthum f. kanehirae TaxID=337451 RepID=A0A3S3NIQ8_9MAGN|nr:pentatricopeptide repeat-containing protein, mitochondrial-like protein [Cinnamomum micranthum f. kanehirae]
MGEEDSSLFDQFERLSFEIQLNQAILGRSYSEPTMLRFIAPPPPQPVFHRRNRSSSSRRFSTALKKLLKPIFGKKAQEEQKSQMPMGSRRVGRLADLFALELLGDL